MAVDKSTWNKKVKVSQSTINDIKGLGMTKALNLAKMNAKSPQAGLVAEYQEATRRLYGDKRFAAATGANAAPKAPTSTGSKQKIYNPKNASSAAAPKQKIYNPANASKPSAASAPKASTKYSPAPMKTPAKKTSGGGISKGTVATVAGTVAAAGLLLAGRGKGVGLATKLAPGLMKNKVAQALLTGEVKKAAPKVVSKAATKASTASVKVKDTVAAASGRAAAKAGKPVSQSQYDAMVAAAKARGITTTAKKAAVKKTVAKKTVAKKAAPAASKGKTALGKLTARGQARWDATAPKAKPTKPKK
jgi:hypothetical protein